jgi:glycerate-2-kinase
MNDWQQWRSDVENIFKNVLEACNPLRLTNDFIKDSDFSHYNNIYVVGWGKASALMAVGLEITMGKKITDSLVLSIEDRDGYIKIRKVPHPLPDESTLAFTKELEGIVKKLDRKDLLICLVSGGGSAMLCDPTVPLDQYNSYMHTLMNAGAEIRELNAFRRSISNVKGGKLGAMCKGQILNLLINDVIEGGLWDIASGPTVEDKSGIAGIEVAKKYGLPISVLNDLDDDRPRLYADSYVLADNRKAVETAHQAGRALGIRTYPRSRSYTGPAGIAAKKLLKEAQGHDFYIAGGESTVEVKGDGLGGRNQHLCLTLHDDPCDCVSAGTDGIDGNSDAAGAFMDEGSRAPDWKDFYGRYDSASFFKRSNSQLITGLTGTNVCDITIIRSH